MTDYTNASRTMLFDIHSLCWNEKRLLEVLGYSDGHDAGSEAIQLSFTVIRIRMMTGGAIALAGSSRRSAGCTVWPMLF